MKKHLNLLMNIVLFLLISAAVIAGSFYCYKNCPDFKSLFGGSAPEIIGEVTDSGETLAQRSERAAVLSLGLFTGIIVIQILALFVAVNVFKRIRKADESAEVKLARIANADVFLDLPLYIGLFGSVSSFMVMSISSSGGQLIAYSSTLIGIIFCTCMRVGIMYPMKSKLIAVSGKK